MYYVQHVAKLKFALDRYLYMHVYCYNISCMDACKSASVVVFTCLIVRTQRLERYYFYSLVFIKLYSKFKTIFSFAGLTAVERIVLFNKNKILER